MKILNLSLDNSAINKTSAWAARALDYGSLVEKYTVVVPSQTKEKIELSEKVKVYGSGGAGKIAQFYNLCQIAKKILQEEKYDVITVQDQYYLALIGLKLARKYRVGLEIQVHGFERYGGLRKLIAKYVLPRASVVRCVSQRLKKQLINEFGVAEEKIMVVPIYTTINSEKPFDKLRVYGASNKQLTINNKKNDGKFIFLTVGRLVPVKNIGLQIEAMAEMVKKYPATELWIVGDGPERENLIRLGRIKLSNNIKFLGQKNKEKLAEIYKNADVFLLTSNSEGWGLAVIEAASYDLPIIMTDVGCAGEVIKNKESGLIIPVGDVKSLIQAMEILWQDEFYRQRIGEGARQAVAALPSKQATLNLFLTSWRQAIG